MSEVNKADASRPLHLAGLSLAIGISLVGFGCKRGLLPEAAYVQIREEARRGQLDAAQRDVDAGIAEYQFRNPDWAARFRVQKAHILVLRGFYSDALQLLEEELPASLTNSETAIRRKMVQGIALDYLQRFEEADRSLAEAADLARSYKPDVLGDIYQARGNLALAEKKYPDASLAFHEALSLSRRDHLALLEASATGSLGYLAMWQEHYDEAIEWFKIALQKSRLLGSEYSIAKALGNIGWNYSAVGDFENAETFLTEAESKSAQAGLMNDRTYWLNSLAAVYAQQHRYAEAEATGQKALSLARGKDDKRTLTECLNTLSEMELATRSVDMAEKHNQEALGIERVGLDRFGIASSTIIAGRIAASKEHFREAEKSFNDVIHDQSVETPVRWESEARLAQLHADKNLPKKAEAEFRHAISTIETARTTLHRDEFRLSFLSAAIEFYDDYIDFLVLHKRTSDALRVAELSRARTLEEGLTTGPDSNAPASREQRPEEFAKQRKAILLFYWIGHNRSYLWVITQEKTEQFTLPKAAEIEPLVKSYQRTILGLHDAQDAGASQGRQLYSTLVGPAEKLIPRGSRVFVLPAESLYGLNFETLIVPDPHPHFWIEDITLTTASSLALLGRSAEESPTREKNLLLVGNTEQVSSDFPPLSQATAEMQKIEHYFPDKQRKVLEGKKATPSAYLSSNPELFTYLHFVTHGTASHTRPLESAVILSKEGDSYKLYARDIVQHHLNANLVTISACNGSGTRSYSGEGLVGLSWAFLRAGAHNVIGALWEVSDASTPQLMDALYGALSQGKDPATALRDAKLSLLHSNDPRSVFKKPFYWAPFQLYAGS